MMRIAVLGASGFVGATLVEALLAEGRHEVVPLIHSTGNAWRLARHGLTLQTVDLLSPRAIRSALDGCTHVVNCSRGPDEVMLQGLYHLLRACRETGVRRLVHLSSVAVYGDPPPPDSAYEDVPPRAERGTYGWIKLQQDRMVAAACDRGLASLILCPPNISGAYSFFVLHLLGTMQDGRFALVEDGRLPCNLVDVRNLTKAIVLALTCERADGTRLFVTDDEETTWADVAAALAPLLQNRRELPLISREDALALQPERDVPRLSPLATLRFLGSARVRATLRDDPLLARGEKVLRAGIDLLPRRTLERLRRWIYGPITVPKTDPPSRYDPTLAKMQLRGVRHRSDRAKSVLGYVPDYSFMASMEVFRSWYETMYGYGSSGWALKEL